MNTASRPNGSPVSVWSADDLRARNVAAELTPATGVRTLYAVFSAASVVLESLTV